MVDVNFDEMPNEKSQSIQDSILDDNAPIQKNANNIYRQTNLSKQESNISFLPSGNCRFTCLDVAKFIVEE